MEWAVRAPAGTPAAIVKSLNAEIQKAMSQPDVMEALGKQGVEPAPGAPEKVASMIAAESAKWTKLIRSTGIKRG